MRVDPPGHDRKTAEIDGGFTLGRADACDAAVFDRDLLIPQHVTLAVDQRRGFDNQRLSRRDGQQRRNKEQATPHFAPLM